MNDKRSKGIVQVRRPDWNVNSLSVEAAYSTAVKQLPNDVSFACFGENVNIHQIRMYFSIPAWKEVLSIISKVCE